ncbi:MAG: hypothetical protein SF069_02950 [Phycisphaerae bacterium]|nr:hypothetical protein [Phycisphaerae bacterium]
MSRFAANVVGSPTIRPVGEGAGIGGGANPLVSDPLVVLYRHGGQERIATFAGHDVTITHPVNDFPTCELKLVTRGPLINLGTETSPNWTPAREVLRDDTVIRIGTARGNPASDVELFRGTPRRIKHSGNAGGETVSVELAFIADVLHLEEAHQIRGQYRPNISQHNAALNNRVSFAAAEPAVFNPKGAGNRYHRFLNDGLLEIPVFWSAYQPDARAWSYAHVLAWLLGVARLAENIDLSYSPGQNFTALRLQKSAFETRLNSLTDGLLRYDPATDPAPSAEVLDPFVRALHSKPRDLVFDGLSWHEALQHLCQLTGIGFVWEFVPGVANDQTPWRLRFFAADAGANEEYGRRTQVYLPGDRYDINRATADIRRDANLSSFALVSDFGGVVNRVRGIGQAIRYEVTVPLAPLWLPNAEWDINSGDANAVSAAVQASNAAAFTNKYVVGGSQYSGQNQLAGRQWGLNTTGRFPASTHARQFGPFTSSVYALFDLLSVSAGEAVNSGSGKTIVKPRPFLPCNSELADGVPLPPRIEVSWDSGSTWRVVAGDVEVSPYDARIRFTRKDLREIENPTPATNALNFVQAYISGRLRVRITAGLAGDVTVDTALVELANPSGGGAASLSRRARARVLRDNSALRLLRDDDGSTFAFRGGNSQYRNSTQVRATRRDDSEILTRDMVARLRGGDRVRHVGTVSLPDLVFFRDGDGPANQSGYRPGDVLGGLLDRTSQDGGKWSLNLEVNALEQGALIGSITWNWRVGDPAGGGMEASTLLTLESIDPVSAFRRATRSDAAGGDA